MERREGSRVVRKQPAGTSGARPEVSEAPFVLQLGCFGQRGVGSTQLCIWASHGSCGQRTDVGAPAPFLILTML